MDHERKERIHGRGRGGNRILISEEISSIYFYIPNAFTPDGDGRNYVFIAFPNDNDISHFSMQVFDRWGGLVFEGDGISVGWDGTKNGEPCPGGVYVYRLAFRVDGIPEEQVITGPVAVVR